MQTFLIYILLGLVQGITEFLPISSSGHLVLLEEIFGLETNFLLLNIILHCATLLAVCWYYRRTLLYLVTHPTCRMNKFLVVATLPAVIFVLIFNNFVDTVLANFLFVGVGFLLTALFLAIAIYFIKRNTNPQPLNYKNATIMGFSQALALFPGLSRSGTTLAFGLVAGTERQTALDFSFLMSIPIIIASLVFELATCDLSTTLANFDVFAVIISAITAFVSALFGLYLMKKVIKNINLAFFIPYLIVVGVVTIVLAG